MDGDIFRQPKRHYGRARINQITLAKDSGLSQSSINQYLNKKRVPSIRAIINMTYALGIDMSDFIDFGSMIE